MVFIPKTNNELKEAVKIWCSNKEKALEKYGEINTWNTINITAMKYLFKDKIMFNDNILNWDISNVIDMNNMFGNCKEFNQDLDNWNLKSLKWCIKMFHGCCSYSYPLFSWTNYNIIMNTQIFDRAINKKLSKAISI